jgi:CubicO group peptidase (beta-lactamase class C family)
MRLLGLVTACLLVSQSSLASNAEPQFKPRVSEATQQHIRHIEDKLLPAALVYGEVPETVTLVSKMRELGVPGVSIAFIHQGRIAWTDGFGVTRLGGPPIDSDTVFQAASLSKPVTAMAVMELVQSGTLDLDRDVNSYLTSWKLPGGRATTSEHVTLRRLLSHTAGTTVEGFGGYAAGEAVPSLIQVLNGERPANSAPVRVETVPGSAWSYSGGGYEIVQQLLFDVTKTPFAQLMDKSVLKPAGMLRSSFEQPAAAKLRGDAATPYDAKGQPISGGAHTYPEQAAAGLWTTASDLARFAINLQRSLAQKSGGILSPAIAREMVGPAGKVSRGSWGLGFQVGGTHDHPYFRHGGANEGFRDILVAFDRGDGIVVMTNGDRGDAITAALLRTVAVEYGWPQQLQPKRHRVIRLPVGTLDQLVGRYRFNSDQYRFNLDATFAVIRKDERLFLQSEGQQVSEIIPDGSTTFFSKAQEMQITFRLDAAGRASGLSINNADDTTSEASRIE